MKKITSNQNLASKLSIDNHKNWITKMIIKSFLLIFVLLSFENSAAQENNNVNDIKEVNTFLTKLKSTSSSDYEKLNNLIYGSNSTVYVKNNTLKTFGENYTVLNLDAASFNFIKNNSIPSNFIEIIRINIKKSSDINQKIDLSAFSEFPNLKYIYIISEINITKQNITNMILNNNENYSIIYQIDQAE